MPLSHKKVYKKPQICGDCHYGPDDYGEIKSSAATGDRDGNPRQVQDPEAGNGEIAFWSDPAFETAPPGHPPGGTGAGRETESAERMMESEQARDDRSSPDSAAAEKVEKLLEERFEHCMREGYEQGLARAEEECRSMQEKAAAKLREAELSLREARQRYKEIISSSEKKIVELSIAIAERLIRGQLDAAPETVTYIVRETMNILNGGEQIDLYVNPADLAACHSYGETLKGEYEEISRLEVIADPGLPRGSCRIESESGVAEYLIDQEKEQLRETLLKIARRDEIVPGEEGSFAYDSH